MTFTPSVKACLAHKCPVLQYVPYLIIKGRIFNRWECTSGYLDDGASPAQLSECPQPPGHVTMGVHK